jgi:hypothetical protein
MLSIDHQQRGNATTRRKHNELPTIYKHNQKVQRSTK